MSERPENGYVALVIACIVALFCIAIVSWTVPYSKGYQAADKDHQSAYAADQAARESREECSKEPSPQKAIECYDEKVTANRDHQRAEQDLDAQREMANWAEGVLWATAIVGCLTVGVAGLGAYWVKETLSATREAVNAADDAVSVTRDIGMMQTRAYLEIKTVTLKPTSEPCEFDAQLVIENVGQTPARDVRFKVFVGFHPSAHHVVWSWEPNPQKATLGPGQVINVAEKLRQTKRRGAFVAIAFVSYRTVWGEKKSTLYRGSLSRGDIKTGRPRAKMYKKNNYST